MILKEKQAREKLLEGAKIVHDVVSKTMGGKGQNIVIKRGETLPFVTKDGVTVARYVNHKELDVQAGVQLMQEAALLTNEKAGDATTATTVLAYNMLKNGADILDKDECISPVLLQRGMAKASELVSEEIDNLTIKDFNVEDIALISANGDKDIASYISKAFDLVGKDGIVDVKESGTNETSVEHNKGMKIDNGLTNGVFVNRADGSCKFDECNILIIDGDLYNPEHLRWHAVASAQEQKPLVVMANKIGGEAEALLGRLKNAGELDSAMITSPLYGEERSIILKDLAELTGAVIVSETNGNMKHLGTSGASGQDRVKSSPAVLGKLTGFNSNLENTLLSFDINENYINEIKKSKDEFTTKRLAILESKIATILVGGNSGVEVQELTHRVEDAKQSAQSSLKHGAIAGGGLALNLAREIIKDTDFGDEDMNIGSKILYDTLRMPAEMILKNAHVTYEVDHAKYPFGYDVNSDKEVNFIDEGIIDSVFAIKSALSNAVSVTSTVLSSGAMVIL